MGKRYGLEHILDAVLAHQILCEYMKRSVAMLKVWFMNMVCFYTFSFVFGSFSNEGQQQTCCGSRIN